MFSAVAYCLGYNPKAYSVWPTASVKAVLSLFLRKTLVTLARELLLHKSLQKYMAYIHCKRFLYQLDHLGETDYVPNPVLEKALDVLFLLHADHELNASCTTVLQTGSSLVDPYSAISAGCASLYGPLHGGANEAVIRMLIAIGSPENVPKFVEQVKRREKVLSGFGHRRVTFNPIFKF